MAEKKTVVIIPTYNEVENIEAILNAIEKQLPGVTVLVVDDNSPDGTQAAVEKVMEKRPHTHLLRRPEKQGLGGAYKAGFQWALDRGFHYLIQMDADFSHPTSTLPVMVEMLAKKPAVIGSRYIPLGGVSGWGWTRKFISRGGNLYAKTLLRMRTHDLTGGFCAWRREVLESIDFMSISTRGYVFQIELKYRTASKGYEIVEVPIHFANRRLGTSKMSGNIFMEAAIHVLRMRRNTPPHP